MTFDWPWMLLVLLAVPLLVLEYRRLLRRRAGRRRTLAELGLVAPPAGRAAHAPAALLLAALTLLLVGTARPEATLTEPRREGTVVLAFDVSGSMAATDLAPTRLEAAKVAARGFVRRQPSTIRLGVVAFGATGLVTQQPTTDRAAVLAAIDRLTPQGGTAVGRGLQAALSAIAGRPVQLTDAGGELAADGPELGFHGSSAVVLLSDGENTADPDPVAVADVASAAGVKVYPIGLGSPAGSVLTIDGFQVSTKLDEALLRRIAATTDGSYFAAADEQQLSRVYAEIDPTWTLVGTHTEITALFALAAGLLLLTGAGLSLARTGRLI